MARGSYNNNGKRAAEPVKAKITKESLREALVLFKYIRPYRGRFIASLVFIALSAFTTALFPLFLGKMIDSVSPGGSQSIMGGNSLGSSLSNTLRNVHWSRNTTLL